MKDYWITRYAEQGEKTVGNRAFTQEDFRENSVVVERLASFFFRKTFSGKVLDFGCGWGRLSKILSVNGCEVFGVDIVPQAIERAQEYVPQGVFQVYDGKELPFPDGSFDGILTWTVLQHIPREEIGLTVSELLRVLKPGGKIVCYENTSPLPDKEHIWFRHSGAYALLFNEISLHRTVNFPRMDGNEEMHTLFVWEKP